MGCMQSTSGSSRPIPEAVLADNEWLAEFVDSTPHDSEVPRPRKGEKMKISLDGDALNVWSLERPAPLPVYKFKIGAIKRWGDNRIKKFRIEYDEPRGTVVYDFSSAKAGNISADLEKLTKAMFVTANVPPPEGKNLTAV